MQRRHLLQALAATTAGPLLASRAVLAAPSAGDTPRFLLVFLRGAYDSASLLVPQRNDFYAESRPNIAIPQPGSASGAATALDTDWALAPAAADTLLPLVQARQLAFVPFAGTDDTSRSHFETQDSIELGQGLGGTRDYNSGFLNRLAAVLDRPQSISFTAQLPLSMRGTVTVPNLALASVGKSQVGPRQAQLITGMYQGTRLQAAVQGGFEARDDVAREMGMIGEMEAANRNAITAKGFEGEARRVARVMRERYRLGFIDVGGWDTHVGQGAAQGTLATRLAELSRGLLAYQQEMGDAWSRTVVVIMSEFGRTFRENGNRGTDHGHGTVYWVLGGAVHGGRVVGEQVAVRADTLFQNRDYPVLNEYRAVLGGLFARQFGLNPAQIAQVFPGAPSRDLGLL